MTSAPERSAFSALSRPARIMPSRISIPANGDRNRKSWARKYSARSDPNFVKKSTQRIRRSITNGPPEWFDAISAPPDGSRSRPRTSERNHSLQNGRPSVSMRPTMTGSHSPVNSPGRGVVWSPSVNADLQLLAGTCFWPISATCSVDP